MLGRRKSMFLRSRGYLVPPLVHHLEGGLWREISLPAVMAQLYKGQEGSEIRTQPMCPKCRYSTVQWTAHSPLQAFSTTIFWTLMFVQLLVLFSFQWAHFAVTDRTPFSQRIQPKLFYLAWGSRHRGSVWAAGMRANAGAEQQGWCISEPVKRSGGLLGSALLMLLNIT